MIWAKFGRQPSFEEPRGVSVGAQNAPKRRGFSLQPPRNRLGRNLGALSDDVFASRVLCIWMCGELRPRKGWVCPKRLGLDLGEILALAQTIPHRWPGTRGKRFAAVAPPPPQVPHSEEPSIRNGPPLKIAFHSKEPSTRNSPPLGITMGEHKTTNQYCSH